MPEVIHAPEKRRIDYEVQYRFFRVTHAPSVILTRDIDKTLNRDYHKACD